MTQRILLDAGSGGRATHRLVGELFLKYFDNTILDARNDAAIITPASGQQLAMSTDGHTVQPLFFAGGDIGRLAVCGTVNDVAMMGARPRWLSAGFIIEEGLEYPVLERVVASMAAAARESNVLIVGGDTKVVPTDSCDQLFITTTGLGEILAHPAPEGNRAEAGDAVLVSGPLGAHGLAVLGGRQSLDFLSGIASDCSPLNHLVEALLETCGTDGAIHVLRDPTRGGLATTLNEIALQSSVSMMLEEESIPVNDNVRDACSVVGLDPLYLANEGCLICVLPNALADCALNVLHTLGYTRAARIGSVLPVTAGRGPQVILSTGIGGRRILPMLEGEQLPRIC